MNESEKALLALLILFLIISMLISLIFICYFVDCQKVSAGPLITCFIFLVLFIFLNALANADIILTFSEEMEDAYDLYDDVFANFYFWYDKVAKVVRFGILPFMINYYETGYYSFRKKLCEYYQKIIKNVLNKFKNKCLLALLIIGIIVAIAAVVIYFMIKDKYGLDNPLSYANYIFIALNIKSLVEIYVYVAFFTVQSCKDYKRQKNPNLINQYYNYSNTMIFQKTEEYYKEITDVHKELEETIQKFKGAKLSGYCNFIIKIFNLSTEKAQKYQPNGNTIMVYSNNYINSNNNNVNNTNLNNNNLDIQDINSNDVQIMKSKDEEKEKEEDTEKKYKNIKEFLEENENKSENLLAEPIRKFKNAVRKLDKMLKLANDIEEEKKDDLTNSLCHCVWITIKYVILLIVFFMVVLSDIILPIYAHSTTKENNEKNITNITVPINSTNSSDNSSNNNEDSSVSSEIIAFIEFFFLLILIIILNSAYTIIVTYSLNRRNYISGDYLSGKKKNDNISLMKTMNEITGYAFALVYCNIYYYKMFYLLENYEKEIIFYNEIEIPDYEITAGIGVFMIAKLVIIFFSIFMFSCTEGVFSFFKSDLTKFNKSI